jgi:hypothetical protein
MSVRSSTPESKPIATTAKTAPASSLPSLLLQLEAGHAAESTGVKDARDKLLKLMGRTLGGAVKKNPGPKTEDERMQAGRDKLEKAEASARAKQENEMLRLKAAQDARQKARETLDAKDGASGRAREVMAIASALVQDAQYPAEDDRYGKGEEAREFLRIVNASGIYEKLKLTKEEERQTIIVVLENEYGGGIVKGSRAFVLVNRVLKKYAILPSDWNYNLSQPNPKQTVPSLPTPVPKQPVQPKLSKQPVRPNPTPTPTKVVPTLTPDQKSRRDAAREERTQQAKSLPLTPWMNDSELKRLMAWMSTDDES